MSDEPEAPVDPQAPSQRSLWRFVGRLAAVAGVLAVALVVVRAQDGRPQAAEGTLWAAVRLQLFGASSVENAAGSVRLVARQSAPSVTLDGAKPVHRDGLAATRFDTSGRVVFRVDADAEPRELTVEQVLSLEGPGTPADLPVRAQLDLTAVG